MLKNKYLKSEQELGITNERQKSIDVRSTTFDN